MPRARVALAVAAALLTATAALPAGAAPDFPTPSPYPISWQLDFKHGLPTRIAVDVPGSPTPKAYWYLTYTVTNNGDKEQQFYAEADLVTVDGQVHHADQGLAKRVYDQIKGAERNPRLETYLTLNGPVRLGPAEARDGVFVWPETTPRMDQFQIYVAGLSGEAVNMHKDAAGKYVKTTAAADLKDPASLLILRRTLQLNYFVRGDEVYPGEDQVNVDGEAWVMR